jgi:hypothetical protein
MDFDMIAANQRLLADCELEMARVRARHEHQAAMFRLGMDVFAGAELGPMYAALNPDPRVYTVARESADRLQAAALDFIRATQSGNDPAQRGGAE